jgi:hypothetical protein
MSKYGVQTNIFEAKPEFDVNDENIVFQKFLKKSSWYLA